MLLVPGACGCTPQAQLVALREGRPERVFAFASPENRAASGPLERFTKMLQVMLGWWSAG